MTNRPAARGELPPSPARTTTTLYSYAERLAGEQAPRLGALLLGMRWSFGLPAPGREELTEYSLPCNPTPILAALAQRGGLRLVRHEGDGDQSLYDHLAGGRGAIAAIDAWYFPFRPAYQRIHSARTALVREGPAGGAVHVHDGWRPAAEGVVRRADLDRARFSDVPLDIEREALFAGVPIGGVWWSVEASPPRVEDAASWMRQRLGWLYEEMAVPRADERGEYGLQALERFRRWLETRLAEPLSEAESVAVRRRGSLLLRPEMSSRLYLGVFLRNAAHLAGDPELASEVALYRQRLGHLQAAMDTLTKTVRVRRPEYDRFILDQLARTCENEQRLACALAAYGAQAN